MSDRAEPVVSDAERHDLYVLQVVGDELSAIAESVLPLLGAVERIQVARNEPGGPAFLPAVGDVDWTLRSLQDGTLGAVTLRTSAPGVNCALLTAPNVFGARLSRWVGTVDFTARNGRSV